jgi:cell division initiation protein
MIYCARAHYDSYITETAVIIMVNPDDILNRKFDKHRGGYRPEEVDEYMAEVASVISRLKRDAADQKRRYDALAAKMAQYESERSSVSDALLNAQKLSDNILRDARTKAETIEKDARGRADSLIGEIRGEITGEQDKLVGMKKEVSSFRSRLMEMYRTHLELINDIPTYHGEEDDSAAQPDSEPEQIQARAAAAERAAAARAGPACTAAARAGPARTGAACRADG